MESPFYNNLYNNLVPTIEPMNRQIIKHQAESDIHAAALKKALMLQPPAIAAPYPIRHPPIQFKMICLKERIFLKRNPPNNKAETNAPANRPKLRRVGPIAEASILSEDIISEIRPK